MIKNNQRFINRVNILLDVALAFLTLLTAYWLRFYCLPGAVHSLPISYYLWLAAVTAALHLLVYALAGFYRLVCELICMLVLISGLYLFNLQNISRWIIVIAFALQMLCMVAKQTAKRSLLNHYRRKGYNLNHILLVGNGESARNYAQMLRAHAEYGYHLLGYCAEETDWPDQAYMGRFSALADMLTKLNPDEVIIALRSRDYVWMSRIIHDCEQVGNAVLKRATDLVCATLMLLATSPLLLVAAVGVKLTSSGPIIFKQERVGKDKRVFKMYKFRSMGVNDREQTGWSGATDDRRTRFGSFLRKFSIDELPQFFNVLKGDMSIVGPRPEVPYYVDQFKDEIPLYTIKHYVKPGITGWAQVSGLRGDTSIKARVEHDIYYIENWTWGFDLKIMLLTPLRLRNEERSTQSA